MSCLLRFLKFVLTSTLKLNRIENMIPKIMIKGIKNFLVCFCKSKIKNIEKIKRIIGILFPDKIIPSKKITKSIGIKNFEILFEYFEKKIGNTKNANKENL